MIIGAFDCATETGWAIGPPGQQPRSGVFRVREKDEHVLRIVKNTLQKLSELWSIAENRCTIIVFEAPMEIGSHKGAAAAVISHMVAGTMIAWAAAKDIPCYGIHEAKWKKSVVGRARMPKVGKQSSSDAMKEAVWQQMLVEKRMPTAAKNYNRSDAVGIWTYAEVRYGNVTPAKLVMFGEQQVVA